MFVIRNLFLAIVLQCSRFLFWKQNTKKFILVIIGPPGAGKGTTSSILARELGIPHLSMGGLLRRVIEEDAKFARKWGPVLDSGRLVPDSVATKVIRKELQKPEYQRGVILDGIPRTLNQAKKFDWMFAWQGNKVNCVVLLELSDDEVLKRLSSRRVCTNPDCGKIYNLRFSPPQVDGICDLCKSPLATRNDDQSESIEERLRVFHKEGTPVCDFYSKAGILNRANSNNTQDLQYILGMLKEMFQR